MRQSIPTVKMHQSHTLRRAVAVLALAGICLSGCGDKQTGYDYEAVPEYLAVHQFEKGSIQAMPLGVQVLHDTLFVSYRNAPRIDKFTLNLEYISTIHLTNPEPIRPDGFYVTDSTIVVADQMRQLMVWYDRDGEPTASFGTLPDLVTKLRPKAVFCYGGVAYVSDIGLGSVLAISMVDAGGITEKGELILTIPGDSTSRIGFPLSVAVTPDGRLLVGDGKGGRINVFTCDGRRVYDFDSIPSYPSIGITDFDWDMVVDSTMFDTTVFDPSGIEYLGRTHASDPDNSLIHMFNPVGSYIASYDAGGRLKHPTGVAIDRKHDRIYVADPGSESIFLLGYTRY